MSDSTYLKLQEFLDRFPLGFPRTASGVEVKILQKLFTEEEARIAVLLSPLPEEASQISRRIGMDEADLATRLEAMSRKGLIFRVRRQGKTFYNAVPFMIGIYEYSVKKVDAELAALFKEYYQTAYMKEMAASHVPGFKVIPVLENISAETVLYPAALLKEEIRAARKISVAECLCRKEARLTGDGCNHLLETCLTFGAAADYYIENGMGREITADEALKILEACDRDGLVHAGVNVNHLSNLCNCCPCCCASMKGITQQGYDKRNYLNALYEAVVDQAACSSCQDCTERCPVGAIRVEATAEVDRRKCLGCGLCASGCSEGAIAMQLRPDREEPFARVIDLGLAILKGKKENT